MYDAPFHYVIIAVVQAFFIAAIQNMLESVTHFKFIDWGMTAVLAAALLVENWYVENRLQI